MARRRRRKGNPLLVRILVISVAAHAIALPIAAHFGAFEKLKKEFGTSRVVMVSLPPVTAEKPKEAAKTEKKEKAAPTKKAGASAPKASAAQKAGPPQPKVVASSGPADGAGGGPTVDANATGKAGALPPGANGAGTTPPTPTPPVEKPPTPTETKPEPPPVTKPVETPKEPEKKPEPPPAPKPKRIIQAEAVESPEPTIPDDLRSEPFEKTLVVEADVDTGGHPTNVQVAQTTGVKELDSIGLDTARKYRFKPATVDDEPVTQHVRFRIIFKVE
jgi:protein TonB